MAEELFATLNTNQGTIVVRLFPDKAPQTVQNFVGLAEGTINWQDPATGQPANRKLYDGTVFHRVIPDFMIQGGDPLGQGIGGPGYDFNDEIHEMTFNRPHLLAMANAGLKPDGTGTNGSQFFITTVPTPHLNGKHTIFGEVVQGAEVADAISKLPTNRQAQPNQPVVLESVTIERR